MLEQDEHFLKFLFFPSPSVSEVDLERHVSCEVCDVSVSGGYDSELNQVSDIGTLLNRGRI